MKTFVRAAFLGVSLLASTNELLVADVLADPQKGGNLVYDLVSGPGTLDPYVSSSAVELEVMSSPTQSGNRVRNILGRKLGAIISVMTDMITAEPTGGISRTYIHEGQKVTKAKGLGPAGIVRLSLDEDVLERLHIAEGLETALGAMSKGLKPMWATGSTASMAKFPVLSGIKALTIIADHDANGAGERAAAAVASRWREAGKEARVWRPKSIGDLNDILIGGAK